MRLSEEIITKPKFIKKQKLYVSGKISGIESTAPGLFKSAENRLIEDGYDVVNPTTINHLDLDSWIGCMKTDIIELMMCDGIYMLTNWKTSRGAIIELDLANSLGMDVIYEYEKDNIKLTNEQISEMRILETVKISKEK